MTISPERAAVTATIITTALEGGIGYWSQCLQYQWRYPDLGASSDAAARAARHATGDDSTAWAHALIVDTDDEAGGESERIGITHAVIERALRRIRAGAATEIGAGRRSRILTAHFANDAAELDANDADAIVQLGLFGELIYG